MNSLIDDPPATSAAESNITPDTADGVPFIARIAGLPASIVSAFRSDRCREEAETINRLSQELASLRAETADRLFLAVPTAPPEMRRTLLAVKRDCFNGREIRHYGDTFLDSLHPWAGDLLARIVGLEGQLATLWEIFEESYENARDQVRELLLLLGEDRELRRGLTLASRDLVENHRRLKNRYALYGRKERSAERSLARYVTRTVVKLSPYSTLTRLGLGAAVSQQGSAVRLLGPPWKAASLVRLKSHVPDQWSALLLRIPQAKEGLQVDLNDTLEDLGRGRHRFLRPWMLQLNEESQELVFVKPSLAKVDLKGPLIDWLKRKLSGGPIFYAELTNCAAADLGARREAIASVLDQFLNAGVLKVLPPWPTYEPYPERRILLFLESSPIGSFTPLDPVRQLLRRLVETQEEYVSTDSPADSIQEIERLASEVFVALKKVLLPNAELTMERGRQDLYEDVLMYLEPGTRHSARGEVLHFDREIADELLEAGDLLWRIRGLFERRHECLHAFYHAARKLWAPGTRVPCLHFFTALEATWKLYIDHLISAKEKLFNPYDLESVHALGALRSSLLEDLANALEACDDGYHLSVGSLRRILTRIPAAYQAPTGACLLVQQADAHGHSWVAHRIGDGSGRLSSRFNTLMQGPLRDWFTSHFTARSLLTLEGEPTELLDLLFTQLTTVNRHLPQTRKVFETSGEFTDLPPDRLVRPADLFVEIGDDLGGLRAVDHTGKRYLPCFLSALHTAWIPTFVKFLAVFGVDTRGRVDIPAPIQRDGSIERWPRLTAGRLVFRRQRWIMPIGQIPRPARTEAAAFATIWQWRQTAGLPERIFWIERMRPKVRGLEFHKPQFIDFTSPTLVSLFLAGLEGRLENELTIFEEALPAPESFPKDSSGEAWGTEFILESIAFQSARRD